MVSCSMATGIEEGDRGIFMNEAQRFKRGNDGGLHLRRQSRGSRWGT